MSFIPAPLAVFRAVVFALIVGGSVGAQYALVQEAQTEAIMLAMNGGIFSHWGTSRCEAFLQQQPVAENDIILQQH